MSKCKHVATDETKGLDNYTMTVCDADASKRNIGSPFISNFCLKCEMWFYKEDTYKDMNDMIKRLIKEKDAKKKG